MVNEKESVVSIRYNKKRGGRELKSVKQNWQLYAMLLTPFFLLILFKYVPMYGAQIAFKNFGIGKTIENSEWVGFKWFIKFFGDYQFKRVLTNTIYISLYSLLASFPISILFAICLNYLKSDKYRKLSQTVTYIPYLISTVVMVTLIMQFLAPRNGVLTQFFNSIANSETDYMAKPNLFADIYVWSGIWQATGFNSIIFIATLIGIDPQLHEAAVIDGASKLQRVTIIDIPLLMPTAIKLLILNTGSILNVGFEKILLMQNPLNLSTSEVISTYVYKVGLTSALPQYSYATAIGLFQSVVSLLLLVLVNKIANKISDSGLW